MVVTGYDDRQGCGYVLRTGADATGAAPPGAQSVSHDGVTVLATPELAATLRDALKHRPTALLSWSGPRVPLTLDDATLLAWLTYDVGGVLTVANPPR
ncbi:hypothetical protein [Pseudonocardia nigra]|uniref:hypothetical protein n=1 Tax=Pseudonocardia nigra TaxID=1921578 RepID=UPI001C5E90E1|nr:hypothetical protein [Pseudonocardia nigra]